MWRHVVFNLKITLTEIIFMMCWLITGIATDTAPPAGVGQYNMPVKHQLHSPTHGQQDHQ